MREWIAEECPALTLDGKMLGTMLRREQELIRCKDCKYHEMRGEMLLCKAQDKPHTYDWYCADGARREYVKPPTESATDWNGVECE